MMRFCNYCKTRIYIVGPILPLAIIVAMLAGCQAPHSDYPPAAEQVIAASYALDINTATAVEFERLPSVGAILAERIIEFREKYGRFRRPEHLLMVQGIGDARFRRIRHLIKAE